MVIKEERVKKRESEERKKKKSCFIKKLLLSGGNYFLSLSNHVVINQFMCMYVMMIYDDHVGPGNMAHHVRLESRSTNLRQRAPFRVLLLFPPLFLAETYKISIFSNLHIFMI